MNGVRSTFMRKGYLITALAALLLLAASSGTASAQSVGFVGTSGTVKEKASEAPTTGDPLIVEVRISGLTKTGPTANNEDGLGMLWIEHDAESSSVADENRRVWILHDGSTAMDEDAQGLGVGGKESIQAGTTRDENTNQIHYDDNGIIRLAIIDPAGDDNWRDDKFTMKLHSEGTLDVSPSPGSYMVTVADSHPTPTVVFNPPSVRLTERSQTSDPVAISLVAGDPMKTDDDPAGMARLADNVQVVVSPTQGVVIADGIDDMCGDNGVISLTLTGFDAGGSGTATAPFQVTADLGTIATSATIGIETCGDKTGFKDDMFTFSFVEKSLAGASTTPGEMLGKVNAGPALTVTVHSDEAVPTVEFATGALTIDEGSMETVAILADTALGPEVGSVMVGVSGEAMISLHQDGKALEASNGHYKVDLMGNANTILTIMAEPDRYLEEGASKTATITIEEANGANIGDRKSLMVTVNDTVGVPALPLIGQLLLALFLMAGGTRLYRRRQS